MTDPRGFLYAINHEDATYNITGISYALLKDEPEIEIPSEINGRTVTGIEHEAFLDCTWITSITIPDTITNIGYYAFRGCTNLVSINIPSSITSIGESAFSGCERLAEVSITDLDAWRKIKFHGGFCNPLFFGAYLDLNGKYVTDLVIPEGETQTGSFDGCGSLTSVTLPDSITYIPSGAFRRCEHLTEVTLGKNVRELGETAFYRCQSLTEISFPDSLTKIGYRAFRDCENLRKVTWGKNIVNVDGEAFYGCFRLDEVHIPDLATWCGTSFFGTTANPLTFAKKLYVNGELLTDLVIPEGVTSLSAYSFYRFRGLNSVVIPAHVTSVGACAFLGCSALTSATIPAGLKDLPQNVFENCEQLKIHKEKTQKATPEPKEKPKKTKPTREKDKPTREKAEKHASLPMKKIGIICAAIVAALALIAGICIGVGSACNARERERYSPYNICLSITGKAPSAQPSAYNGGYATDLQVKVKNNSVLDLVAAQGVIRFDFGTSGGLKEVPYTFSDVVPAGGERNCILRIDEPASDSARDFYYEYPYNANFSISQATYGDGVTKSYDAGAYFSATVIADSNSSILQKTYEKALALSAQGEYLMALALLNDISHLMYCEDAKAAIYTLVEKEAASIASQGDYAGVCAYLAQFGYTATSSKLYQAYEYASQGNLVEAVANGLTIVVFPEGTVSIPANYFSDLSNRSEIEKIVLPASVTTIGKYAFHGCTGLKSVNIPASVTTIDASAFEGCDGLEAVHITDLAAWCEISFANIYANPLVGGENLYLNGELVTDLVIPSGVAEIGAYAFATCENITSVRIPVGVTTIGESAFEGCTGLTETLTIPDSLRRIGTHAFWGCSALEGVAFGEGVREIGTAAFYDCTNLGAVYISDIAAWCGISFESDYSNPLAYAKILYVDGERLTDLVIPDTVTQIGAYAFDSCESLISAVIPDSVRSIGKNAFGSCYGLTSVTIGAGVSSIADGAFGACYALAEVKNLSALNIVVGDYGHGGIASYAKRVYQAGDSYLSRTSNGCILYQDGTQTVLVKYVGTSRDLMVESGVTEIGAYAFFGCKSLVSVSFPEGVKQMGEHAFDSCTNLESVIFSEGLENISYEAFLYCDSLARVTIPQSVTYIDLYAFLYCYKLERINYGGTTAQWEAMGKAPFWHWDTGEFTISCTDGTISKADS